MPQVAQCLLAYLTSAVSMLYSRCNIDQGALDGHEPAVDFRSVSNGFFSMNLEQRLVNFKLPKKLFNIFSDAVGELWSSQKF